MSLQKIIIILITFQLSNLYAQNGFESLGAQAQLSLQDFSNRKVSKPVQLNISGSQYFDLDFRPPQVKLSAIYNFGDKNIKSKKSNQRNESTRMQVGS